MKSPTSFLRFLPPVLAAVPITIFRIGSLTLILSTAQALRMPASQVTSWIAVCYGFGGIAGLILTFIHGQPFPVAFSTGSVVFLAAMAGLFPLSDLHGGMLVSGAVILFLSLTGLSSYVERFLPDPILKAALAGATLPFVSAIFSQMGVAPGLVGGALAAYLLTQRLFQGRIPAILPALLVGFGLPIATGKFNVGSTHWAPPALLLETPTFSFSALITIVPIVVALISFQGNIPAILFLRSQGYRPPAKAMGIASGILTLLGSFVGLTPFCLPGLVIASLAGEDAGDFRARHWSVYVSSILQIAIGLLAGMATGLFALAPITLLHALVGIALLGVLVSSLREAFSGPLKLGPAVALAVTVSGISYLNLGALFWAMIFGVGITLLLEGPELRLVRASVVQDAS